ncbi:MAG: hypothetical protein OXP36_12545, partial [Gammaproteobacteria bacterium]|nr:hypothetical protein [Gammaproteobacteria bacterium]
MKRSPSNPLPIRSFAGVLAVCMAGCAPNGAATDAPQAEPADPSRASVAEDAERSGIVTTDSGLQYEILVSGNGATPGPTDTVTTHYHGTFVD